VLDDLVLVLAIAAVVPLALAPVPRLALPAAVVEILAGIVLGPGVLGLVEPDQAVRTLASIGLAFLLFLAGLEIDVDRLRGSGARLALRGLLLSLAAAVLTGAALQLFGAVDNGRLLGVLLLATSLGLVVPVLRDAGLTDRPVGQLVVVGASLGELAALVLLSLSFSERSRGPGSVVLLLGLLAAAAVVVLAARCARRRRTRVSAVVARLSDTSAQIRVRPRGAARRRSRSGGRGAGLRGDPGRVPRRTGARAGSIRTA
jgi:Kef-type K+ transport system membrane component KefB